MASDQAAILPRRSGSLRPVSTQRLGRLAIPPLAVFVVCLGTLLDGFNSAMGSAIAGLLCSLLVSIQLMVAPPRASAWRAAAPVLALIGTAILWVTIASVAPPTLFGLAPPPRFAPDLFLPQLLALLAGIAALLSGWSLGGRARSATPVIDLLVAFNTAWLVLGFVIRRIGTNDLLGYWDVSWHGRFAGAIGNANATAAIAGATALLALSTALPGRGGAPARRRRWLRPAATVLVAGVSLTAQLATAGRLSLLLTLPMATVIATGALLRMRSERRAVSVSLAAVVGVLAFLVLFGGLTLSRLDSLLPAWSDRAEMWRHYAGIASRSPLFGFGLGAFPSVNAYYLDGPHLEDTLWLVNSPHDILLQLWLNGGLPYLALLLGAAVKIAADVIVARPGNDWSAEETGLAAAVALICAAAIVDITLDIPAVAIQMCFLAGLLWGRARARAERAAHDRVSPPDPTPLDGVPAIAA